MYFTYAFYSYIPKEEAFVEQLSLLTKMGNISKLDVQENEF